MTEHAVVIAGAGPTGLMLAGELALAGVDVAIVERRVNQDLPGSLAGGLQFRTIEIPGWHPRTSASIAEVEVTEEPDLGIRLTPTGTHAIGTGEYEIKDGEVV